jgi:integrase
MSSDVRNLLKGLIANNNGSRYVFNYFNHSKNDFVPVKSIYIAFSSACKRAKISGLQFRDLRRTFSSRLHELNTDPLLIQRLLRHSSFRISEEVYIQSSMELMKNASEKLCQKSI